MGLDIYIYRARQAAYWRKANQVLRFFAERTGETATPVFVIADELRELLRRCEEIKKSVKLIKNPTNGEEVIDKPELCKALLPTQGGPYFGSTEYGLDYMEDIDSTIKQLRQILAEDAGEEDYVDYVVDWSW